MLELRIPPLRERRGDIPLLLDHFLRLHWRRPGETPRWSPQAEAQLLGALRYPGNVRELEHLVERACLLARGQEMDVTLLPAEVREAQPAASQEFGEPTKEGLRAAREAAVAAVERQFLETLTDSSGRMLS